MMADYQDEAVESLAGLPDRDVDAAEATLAEVSPVSELEPLDLELPDDPGEANEVLIAALRQSLAQEAEFLDRWQRSAADFENLRKRSMREQQQIRSVAAERVVGSMLPTLDSFQAAMELPAETDNERKLLAGIEATYLQLMDVLGREGLTSIPGVGAPFDPTVHDAVTHLGDSDTLVVVGELRRGYRLNDKVLRAALVAVGPSPDSDGDGSDHDSTNKDSANEDSANEDSADEDSA